MHEKIKELGTLSAGEMEHINEGIALAKEAYERCYEQMLSLGHDPASAESLAQMEVSATNHDIDSTVHAMVEELKMLRGLGSSVEPMDEPEF